jgi:hypothetical protein
LRGSAIASLRPYWVKAGRQITHIFAKTAMHLNVRIMGVIISKQKAKNGVLLAYPFGLCF